MAIPAKTKKYLDKQLMKYEPLVHKTVYTAYDAAQTLRRELKEIAKSLLVATDKAYILAVVPAHMRIDLNKLKKAVGAKKINIPKEQVMIRVFKVKAGGMTAFGGLHKLEVWADKSLLKTKDLILSVGSLTDSVRMKTSDYLKQEQAKLANFSASAGYSVAKKVKVKSKKGSTKLRKSKSGRGKTKARNQKVKTSRRKKR